MRFPVPRSWRQQLIGLSLIGCVAVWGIAGAAEEPSPAAKIITADVARNHVGQKVTVTFKVLHTKAATNPERVYIDSEKDYRDPRNLGILIESDSLPAFAKAGIPKPATHYEGKNVRITGTPFLRNGDLFIRATEPSQIEILDAKAEGSPASGR